MSRRARPALRRRPSHATVALLGAAALVGVSVLWGTWLGVRGVDLHLSGGQPLTGPFDRGCRSPRCSRCLYGVAAWLCCRGSPARGAGVRLLAASGAARGRLGRCARSDRRDVRAGATAGVALRVPARRRAGWRRSARSSTGSSPTCPRTRRASPGPRTSPGIRRVRCSPSSGLTGSGCPAPAGRRRCASPSARRPCQPCSSRCALLGGEQRRPGRSAVRALSPRGAVGRHVGRRVVRRRRGVGCCRGRVRRVDERSRGWCWRPRPAALLFGCRAAAVVRAGAARPAGWSPSS